MHLPGRKALLPPIRSVCLRTSWAFAPCVTRVVLSGAGVRCRSARNRVDVRLGLPGSIAPPTPVQKEVHHFR